VWESAEQAVIAGDVSTLERLLREHPELVRARSTQDKCDIYCDVVALLVAAGATVPPAWFVSPARDEFVEQVQAAPRMLAALGGRA